ncbi:hypothetical protein EJB05_23316, partial [Eragrostis curvula]
MVKLQLGVPLCMAFLMALLVVSAIHAVPAQAGLYHFSAPLRSESAGAGRLFSAGPSRQDAFFCWGSRRGLIPPAMPLKTGLSSASCAVLQPSCSTASLVPSLPSCIQSLRYGQVD